jgi:hypothetical protein
MICLQGRCYQIVETPHGTGYIPSSFKPTNRDISAGPVFV